MRGTTAVGGYLQKEKGSIQFPQGGQMISSCDWKKHRKKKKARGDKTTVEGNSGRATWERIHGSAFFVLRPRSGGLSRTGET